MRGHKVNTLTLFEMCSLGFSRLFACLRKNHILLKVRCFVTGDQLAFFAFSYLKDYSYTYSYSHITVVIPATFIFG